MKYYNDLRIQAHRQPLEAEAQAERLAKIATGRHVRRTAHAAIAVLVFMLRPMRIAMLAGMVLVMALLAVQLIAAPDSTTRVAFQEFPEEYVEDETGRVPYCAIYSVKHCVD